MTPNPLILRNVIFKFTDSLGQIEVNTYLDEPEKLYKYYSLSDYSLKSLKKNTIYFSHANLLNDVMDGNFMLWDMNDFIKQYNEDKEIKSDISKESILKQITKPFLECRGVFSLCDTYKNELIWAHYTNETGYCIEFETKKLKKNINENRKENDCYFFPISYGNLQQINFSEYIHCENEFETKRKTVNAMLPILYCFAQKENSWKYENEWRFLLRDKKFNSISFPIEIINDELNKIEKFRKSGGNIKIKKNIISKVILAPLFFNNSRFNKVEITNSNLLIYNFKDDISGKTAKEFLEILKYNFKNKIYQIDKIIKDKVVVREIKYKIEIIDICEGFVKLEKIEM
jgi:hypothetical protein